MHAFYLTPGFLSCFLTSQLQGPTVSPVFCKRDGEVVSDFYAIVICVPKKALYESVQQLREVSPAHKVGSCLCF